MDWTAIAAAGNVYRHGYDVVDQAQLWRTAEHGLVRLYEIAVFELKRIG